jgi:pimeloyl-ACP methyl ester carboxylesterase
MYPRTHPPANLLMLPSRSLCSVFEFLPTNPISMTTTISADLKSCNTRNVVFCALLLCCFVGLPYQQASKSEGISDIGISLSAVASDSTSSTLANDNTPRRIDHSEIWRDAKTKRKTIIIFVHGITGDCRTTWTNENTGAIWPELLVHDDAFAEADVLSYGYSSPQNEPALLIPELAVQMRDTLEQLGALDHERIVFVAHSMGGLIVRSMMLLPHSEDIVRRIRCLFLLATPHLGSDFANVAKYVLKNPAYGQLGPHGRGSFCNELIQNYLSAGFDTPCYAVYETKPTYGYFWIVSSESALSLSHREPQAIEADQIAICRPKDTGADVYREFRKDFLESMSRGDTNITVRVVLNRVNGTGVSHTAVSRANDGTQLATTDETGTCHLTLRDTKPGDQVTLSATRDGFTVVDPDALRIRVPSDPKSELQILLCDINEVEKWQQQLLRDKKQQDLNQRFASMAPAEQPVRERLTAQKLSSEKLDFLISPIPPGNNGYLSLARALFSNGRSEDALDVLRKSQADNVVQKGSSS